jgi:hypothetical protein
MLELQSHQGALGQVRSYLSYRVTVFADLVILCNLLGVSIR